MRTLWTICYTSILRTLYRFHSFFAAIDNLKSARLLYLSSVGLAAGNYGISSGKLKSGDADDATLLDSDSDGEGTAIDDDVDNPK